MTESERILLASYFSQKVQSAHRQQQVLMSVSAEITNTNPVDPSIGNVTGEEAVNDRNCHMQQLPQLSIANTLPLADIDDTEHSMLNTIVTTGIQHIYGSGSIDVSEDDEIENNVIGSELCYGEENNQTNEADLLAQQSPMNSRCSSSDSEEEENLEGNDLMSQTSFKSHSSKISSYSSNPFAASSVVS